MTNPFTPTHDLYVIPVRTLENELKKWIFDTKQVNILFEFDFEQSESSLGHMGDLYFLVHEEQMPEKDTSILQNAYGDRWGDLDLGLVLQDFFDTTYLSYDIHPFDEEVYIRIRK